MRRTIPLVLPLVVALVLLATSSVGGGAEEDASPPPRSADGLLAALARVPAGAAAEWPVSYVDFRAVEAARPGAARPASLAELLALRAADDEAAARWFAAAMGIASGPVQLLRALLGQGEAWPASVGFDFFDVDQAVAFGSPPTDGMVLLGGFRPGAVRDAFAARGYTATAVGERTLLCPEAGCESGHEVDLTRRDPSIPFGGDLGRHEPLSVAEDEILASADLGTLEAMLAAATGEVPSLKEDPPLGTLLAAIDPDVLLIQGLIASPTAIGVGSIPPAPGEADPPMALPPWSLAVILDGATESEQVVIIALAHASEAEAARAAEALETRIASVPSERFGRPLSEILAERGVTSVEPRTGPPDAGGRAAAVLELRAPLAGDEPTEAGGSRTSSSLLYRLFVDLLYSRDAGWLAPGPSTGG